MKRPIMPRAALGLALVTLGATAHGTAAQAILDAGEVVRSMGTIDGPPGRTFHNVESVIPLPSGDILVADGGSRQLRLYGEAPDPRWTFGREGQGPGEFIWLDWAARYRGDSLVAWDAQQARLTIVTPDGRLGRTVTVGAGTGVSSSGDARASAARRLTVVGTAADGGFVARQGDLHVGAGDTTAVRRDRFTYVMLGPEGEVGAEIVVLPDDETFVWATERSRAARPRAFGRVTSIHVAGSTFAWAANEGFQAHVMDLASGTERVVRAEREARPVSDADRRAWREANGPSDGLSDRFRASMQAQVDAMLFPDVHPWHGALLLDDAGGVWLEEAAPGEREGPVWTVFTASGAERRVRFPEGFRPTAVADGRAWGVATGEFDVERVVVIDLPAELKRGEER